MAEGIQEVFELDVRQPIKGYPELRWTGKRPYTSEHYYPAQSRERYGEPVAEGEHEGWINKIFWGDNKQVLGHLLREYRGKVDLIYIDPPFDSKADYKKKISLRGKSATNDSTSFEEKQYGDIWTNDEYLQFMYERLILCRELLSDTGSIYLHCDWHKSGHLRLLLDEVFGVENFQNEIIWKRSSNTSSIGKIYKRAHDMILFYSKSSDYVFTSPRKPLSEASIKMYNKVDENGRKYQLVPLLVSGRRSGETGKPWRGIDPNSLGQAGMHWVTRHDKLEWYEREGLIEWTSGGSPRLRYFLDQNEGALVSDLWDDINLISSNGAESQGYPTQKPEALLERIIKASSKPGGLVFDCFMGSGTTQAVAMKLGRRFLGADINLGAIQTTTKRLINVAKQIEAEQREKAETLNVADDSAEIAQYYTDFEVYNVNNYNVFRNPIEAKNLLIQALEIQPFPESHVFDGELDGRMVKIMPVNRIATRADLEPLVANLPWKKYEKAKDENPRLPVEAITLVCMGHEAELKASLIDQFRGYKVDVEVVDILRDRSDIEFKHEAEAEVVCEGNKLVIRNFFPLNLMQKLSLDDESVEDWRELTESVMIDWNYDGVVLEPAVTDIPSKNELVKGIYDVPDTAGTIRVKITDLLSESIEIEVE